MIQGVLFDMDGVLLDTERVGFDLLPLAAKQLGYDFTAETYQKVLGVNRKTSARIYRELFGEDFPCEELDRIFFQSLLRRAENGGMPLKKGFLECIAGLKERGVKIALATSSDRKVVQVYQSHTPGMEGVFDEMVCGLEISRGKPEPDIYLLAAEKLGLSPAQCVGVEDSRFGLMSLRAAGCFSVMIPDLLPYDESLAPYVDERLADLTQVCPLLDRLNGRG